MVSKNGSIAKNGVLPVITFFFENFVSVQEPLVKTWFDVTTTQMPIFVLFVGAGAFSQWVSFPIGKKTSTRCLFKTGKTSCRCPKDVLNANLKDIFVRHLEETFARYIVDVLQKTS